MGQGLRLLWLRLRGLLSALPLVLLHLRALLRLSALLRRLLATALLWQLLLSSVPRLGLGPSLPQLGLPRLGLPRLGPPRLGPRLAALIALRWACPHR